MCVCVCVCGVWGCGGGGVGVCVQTYVKIVHVLLLGGDYGCFRTPKNRVRHLVLPEYRFLTASEYVCIVYFLLSSHFGMHATNAKPFGSYMCIVIC